MQFRLPTFTLDSAGVRMAGNSIDKEVKFERDCRSDAQTLCFCDRGLLCPYSALFYTADNNKTIYFYKIYGLPNMNINLATASLGKSYFPS